MRTAVGPAIVGLLLVLGCGQVQTINPSTGSSGAGGTLEGLCNGSPNVRFAAAIPWRGHVQAGTGVLWELGLAYLLVNGRCEYATWTKDPTISGLGQWAPIRGGVLGDSDARELAMDFHHEHWSEVSGTVYGPDEAVYDGPKLVLFDGSNRIVCNVPCDLSAPALGDAVSSLEALNRWIGRLYDGGTDLDGNIRLRVFEVEYSGIGQSIQWPLEQPPGEYVSDSAHLLDIWGPAQNIHEQGDRSALRASRSVARSLGYGTSPAMAAHPDPAKIYIYAFRDVTPFEDVNGRLMGYDQ
jgi:hypothetical protein